MILIHLQAGEGVIGAWRVIRDNLESAYAPGTNAKLIEVAQSSLYKGKKQDWSEVFEYATRRSPYGSQYAMSPLGDEDDELDYLLRKAQRLYSRGELEFSTQYDTNTDSSQ
jgi:hypothetical protein